MTTYESGQLATFTTSQNEARRMARQMMEHYSRAQNEIIADLERVYGKYLSAQNPADYYGIMINYDRLNKLLSQVQQQYNFYARAAGKSVKSILAETMKNSYYRQQYVLTWFAPDNISFSFSRLDPRLVELTVSGTAESWKQLKKLNEKRNIFMPKHGTLISLLEKNRVRELTEIQRSITQMFIQGKSVDDAAREIRKKIDISKYNAERIVRTESTRCANAGDYAATLDAAEHGLPVRRQWLASLDLKTRDTHAELDGQTVGIDEEFSSSGGTAMFPGGFGIPEEDINCRCTVITLIDGVQPGLRLGVDPTSGEYRVFDYKNYNQWLADNDVK